MSKKSIISLILAGLMAASMLSGCTGGNSSTASSSTTESSKEGTESSSEATAGGKKDDVSTPYTFKHYFNYDWWTIKEWKKDEASKFLAEKFNVNIEFSKPDADPAAKLNLMISSGDLPDAIMMDRSTDLIKLARTGQLVPLDELKYEGNDYDANILTTTQELLKTEGTLYSIPNWARKGPTGGNDGWIYDKALYEKAGSPKLDTFEAIYDYVTKLKNEVKKTDKGADVIPFMTGETADGFKLIRGFYRSFGGANLAYNWFTRYEGKLQFAFRDPVYKQATMELNKWYREGLFSETLFTDTPEQTLEKLTSGRIGMLWYDFSQDSVNRFRQILKEDSKGADDYIVLTDPVYPPQKDAKKVYADEKPTPGWNVTVITKKATNPQRIFDLYSYFLTKEGSINMMYGPQGQLWDELDAEGNPVLKTPESELSSDERTRLGLWNWAMPGHSDNVDMTKFAVNAAQPKEKQDWTISLQSDVFTPIMFVTDEYVNLDQTIDPQDDIGIKRQLILDTIKADFPKVMMAKSADEASAAYDKLVKFCDDNGMADIEAKYDELYQANVKIQGQTAFPDH